MTEANAIYLIKEELKLFGVVQINQMPDNE